ncbi:MAG: TIGR00266 family protein [Eubacterium sp.]|nr:TIGR00266 family protein [Eubacterium sp.]
MQYEIKGEPLPVVICQLESGESLNCESGAMSWMTPNMEMKTSGGGVGKMFGKMLSGENLFQNTYTCKGGQGLIAFASSFPGSIRALEITPSNPVVVQKSGYLASEPGVELSVFFQKKAMGGLFGGEGFIMQKLSGNGMAFVEFDGSIVEYDLDAGESLQVDTGHVAMMDASCTLDVKAVKGVKNMLLGGEGLFNTVVTGPGRVWLQTMPVVNFVGLISTMLPSK